MRGNTTRLGADISQNIILGKITRQCLCRCWASLCMSLLPLSAAPSLAQKLLVLCSEGISV